MIQQQPFNMPKYSITAIWHFQKHRFIFVFRFIYNIIHFMCTVLYLDFCINFNVLTTKDFVSIPPHTVDPFYPFHLSPTLFPSSNDFFFLCICFYFGLFIFVLRKKFTCEWNPMIVAFLHLTFHSAWAPSMLSQMTSFFLFLFMTKWCYIVYIYFIHLSVCGYLDFFPHFGYYK